MIVLMKEQIEFLRKKLGPYEQVAKCLEITPRQLFNAKKGKPISKALRYRIESLTEQVKKQKLSDLACRN